MKLKRSLATILLITMCFGLTAFANDEATLTAISLDDVAMGATKAYLTYNLTWGDATEGTLLVGAYDGKNNLVGMNYASTHNGKFYADIMVEYSSIPTYFKTFMWNNPTDMMAVSNVCQHNAGEVKISVKFGDIREIICNGNTYTITYYLDKAYDKKATFTLPANVAYTINNQKDNSFTTADLAQKVDYGGFTDEGNYTVIDFALAGETGGCDYNSASISVYENFVVDSYDALANKVFAHDYSPSILSVIDYDADYARFIVDKEGKAVDPATLTKYDVLTMKIAPYDWGMNINNIDSVTAVLSRDFVEGEIREINEIEGKYYIGDEIYEIDPTSTFYLQLGEKGKFHLDANGMIAAFDRASQKSGNYGVIVDKNANNGIYEYYQIKMFTSDGILDVKTFATKVKVHRYDSYSGETYTQVYQDYDVYDMIGTVFPLICSYRLNGDEEIYDISIATENGVNVTENSSKSSAIVQNNTTGSGKIKVDKVATKVDVGRQYNIDNNTKIIAMENTTDPTDVSIDNFALYTASDFSADQTFDKVSLYDVDENNCASLIFIYDEDITLLEGTGGGDPEDTTDVIMTKTTTEANNADGDATIRIYGYNKDGETNKLFDDMLAVNLQPGEVFFPKTLDANGDVTKYVKILGNESGAFRLTREFLNAYRDMCDAEDDSTYYFGKVDYKMRNEIYFENLLDDSTGSFAAKYESIVLPDAIKVMVYDQSKADGYKVSYEDANYMSYSSRVNADGSYPIAKPSIKSYYILAREFKGKIVDVFYYCYTTDVSGVILPNIIY